MPRHRRQHYFTWCWGISYSSLMLQESHYYTDMSKVDERKIQSSKWESWAIIYSYRIGFCHLTSLGTRGTIWNWNWEGHVKTKLKINKFDRINSCIELQFFKQRSDGWWWWWWWWLWIRELFYATKNSLISFKVWTLK